MSPAPTRSDQQRTPWLVRKHHVLRTLSFALLMVAVTLHLWGTSASPWLWTYLATQLLVYPHLMYLRARWGAEPIASELRNLLIDAYLLGLCATVLGLPIWIAFSMAMGALINNAFNKGWRGSVTGSIAYVAGGLSWWATGRFTWQPDTQLPTTLWCIAGVMVYVLALGDIAFIRIRQLRHVRQENNRAATALSEANASLQQQLDEINSLQVQLREQALRDPLTGQYNRRYLDATLEREILRCQRHQCSIALLMIDIDHFKRINDTHGHQAGDEVLRQVGFMLGAHARSHDVVCRYGGEEFLILLPELPLDAAQQRAEQVRLAVENQHFQTASGSLQLTLSVGVAAFPMHGHTPDALLHSADTALYAAKRQGRNQVVVSDATAGDSAAAGAGA
jgi:diguanylate cyclase (GGDEF)-like protein